MDSPVPCAAINEIIALEYAIVIDDNASAVGAFIAVKGSAFSIAKYLHAALSLFAAIRLRLWMIVLII